MKTFGLINLRGGCGKSTTVQNLAAVLTKKHGLRVLIVDLDPQSNTSYTFNASSEVPNVLDVLEKKSAVREAIQPTPYGDLLAATRDLFAAEQILNGEERFYALKDALEEVQNEYDICLIDTSPSLNVLTHNTLIASDSVLIPLIPDAYSMQGFGMVVDVINEVKDGWNPDLKIEGLILNRVERGNLIRDAQDWARQTAQELGTRLFDSVIHKSLKVSEAQLQQKALIDHAPRNRAMEDYEELTAEILKGVERDD